MNNKLFDEFAPVSEKEWKQRIQVDLKGEDYNESLIWESPEGIHVKPFYTKHDLNNEVPNPETKTTSWKICQTIYVADTKLSNKKALEILKKGVDSIRFIIPSKDTSIEILLENIPLDVELYFNLQFLNSEFVSALRSLSKERTVFFEVDIIENLSRTGNWFNSLKADHEQLDAIFLSSNKNTLHVDANLYQNAGANIVQQLAYTLAHTHEYLNYFKSDLNGNTSFSFHFSIGSNYFFEISKLKAFRSMFAKIAEKYGINPYCHILVSPSKRNKTLYDYNTNMLRTTTEYMSAILGGADCINTLAYDEIYHKTNEFGDRMARNQLLILKHESYFNYVDNPTDGAYYIEDLTYELSEKAQKIYNEIVSSGGFLKQLKEGTIQKKIKESAEKEQLLFDEGKVVLLGSNKHPNPKDKMKDELEIYPFVKQRHEKTLIEPIISKRLAENLEQTRLKTE